jgi:hypothetical protein
VANCTTSRTETLEEDIVAEEKTGDAALLFVDSEVAVLSLLDRLPCNPSELESDLAVSEDDDEDAPERPAQNPSMSNIDIGLAES